MHKCYGANSVLYISFGTFAHLHAPRLFDSLVKTILAADPPLPFLFASGSKMLTLEHREKIEKSGRGLLAGFVPQQAVLKHEGTGWFLCHAGYNSTYEAFMNEVPMVLWPLTVDQPLIANQLSVGLKLAYELIQVRNGESIGRRAHRGPAVHGTSEAIEQEMKDVWKLMRSEDGDKMRERVIAFSKAMKEEYRNGTAHRAMEGFSEFMTNASAKL
ncbi:UDP-Glycosyltransferase/glycogen phosphorylase [Gymnopus androsaceus JB14]|uniref:UDP-Glycosyltransferase/glycogen phosphorylase n=1 Tax=Gymnopus androsaceus JB14 TaxID=1447944 RepID=A0A6A4H0X3_9AGAR|nr:UDP-Glycosyltransferase/glycogen phosphorylase [Gymnopus androsaceus JB14]